MGGTANHPTNEKRARPVEDRDNKKTNPRPRCDVTDWADTPIGGRNRPGWAASALPVWPIRRRRDPTAAADSSAESWPSSLGRRAAAGGVAAHRRVDFVSQTSQRQRPFQKLGTPNSVTIKTTTKKNQLGRIPETGAYQVLLEVLHLVTLRQSKRTDQSASSE